MKDSELIIYCMADAEKQEYTIDDLRWLTAPFSVSGSSLRTNLHRLSSKNHINIKRDGRQAFYRFGKKGREISQHLSLSFLSHRWKAWDQTWWGIIFAVPDSFREERYKIRKELRSCRFSACNPGFWIRPRNPLEQVEKKLSGLLSLPYCRLIRYQWATTPTLREVHQLWEVSVLNRRMYEATRMLDRKIDRLGRLDPLRAYRDHILTSYRLVSFLDLDPYLPEELLPDNWRGTSLRQLFRKWAERSREQSKTYRDHIFQHPVGFN